MSSQDTDNEPDGRIPINVSRNLDIALRAWQECGYNRNDKAFRVALSRLNDTERAQFWAREATRQRALNDGH